MLSYSQAGPGRELMQPRKHLFAEPCTEPLRDDKCPCCQLAIGNRLCVARELDPQMRLAAAYVFLLELLISCNHYFASDHTADPVEDLTGLRSFMRALCALNEK